MFASNLLQFCSYSKSVYDQLLNGKLAELSATLDAFLLA